MITAYFYKRPYKQAVQSASIQFSLPKSLIYAVIKAESSFNRVAVSSKGAKGLMQITDGTAKFIAKELGIVSYDIFEAKTNITFGCFYIRYLMDNYGDLTVALCCYNAGMGNVNGWLKDKNYSKDGVHLDKIPFKETANYVKKVTRFCKTYKLLYG